MLNSNYLSAYNPFREMAELERNFFGDQKLAEFKTDISDEGDYFLLEADLPGFEKKDISLEVNGETLTIHAERHSRLEQKDQQNKVVRMERSYGTYGRSFDISGIDINQISARYENGVLSLNLPKMQKILPETRKLEIQ